MKKHIRGAVLGCAGVFPPFDRRPARARRARMRRLCASFAGWPLVLGLGCGGGLGNFTEGRDLDRCDDTYPVCQVTAGCVLQESEYVEGTFPGQRQVIVVAPAGAVIHVDLYFVDETASGVDTEIRWHEPGCFETYRWASEGRDIFLEAGDTRVLSESRQVEETGDHLIEIFSDATLEYWLRVRVDAP